MTLQEAIEIIEQQKKYITGNPMLLEAYDVLLENAQKNRVPDEEIHVKKLEYWDCGAYIYLVWEDKKERKYIAYDEEEAIRMYKVDMNIF